MAALRLGLVGCGRLAERGWLPAIEATDGVMLTAVADPEPSRRAIAPPSATPFPDAAGLVEAGRVDALLVASPAGRHLADAELAAGAEIPCLVEKPPAEDLAGAIAIAELEPAPWLGFNRRFEPGVGKLRESVPEAGWLEILVELRYRRRSWSPYSVRDDALLDLGPHAIDLGRWLSGAEVVRVRAARVAPEEASLELELDRGRGRVRVECACEGPWRERLEVRADGGRLVGRVGAGGLLRGVASRLRPPQKHPLVASLSRQLTCFAAAVHDGVAGPLGGARDGVAVMAAIEAARTSASAAGGWEPVPDLEPAS